MLQSVLFHVMNTSIMGTPCDIVFYWKDEGPKTIVPQGPLKPLLALFYLRSRRSMPTPWLKKPLCRYRVMK